MPNVEEGQIVYASRSLSLSEKNYSQIEKKSSGNYLWCKTIKHLCLLTTLSSYQIS